jgi:hypothetical protein
MTASGEVKKCTWPFIPRYHDDVNPSIGKVEQNEVLVMSHPQKCGWPRLRIMDTYAESLLQEAGKPPYTSAEYRYSQTD